MTREEFRHIILRYERPVISVIYKMVYDWETARDLAQDVFVNLWRSGATHDRGRSLFTLLYRMSVNRAIDHLRKFRALPVPDTEEIASPDPADDEVQTRELQNALRDCALRLAPRQRAVFVLRDLEGLSFEEIADMVGQSVGAVRSNLHLARQAVRDHLVKSYHEVLYEYGM